ncbi:MAG: hypothetical protein AAF587_22745 [Bacteroidota bacterium]
MNSFVMRPVIFSISLLVWMPYFWAQTPLLELYLMEDQLEYRGVDVVIDNDSTIFLAGTLSDWDSSYTGFPIEGSATIGFQLSKFRLDSAKVISSQFFPIPAASGFETIRQIIRLSSNRLAISYRQAVGILACEDDSLTGTESNKINYLIVDKDLNILFDSLSQNPYCELSEISYLYSHDKLYTTLTKSELEDSVYLHTLDSTGRFVNKASLFFEWEFGSPVFTHDSLGLTMIHPDLARFKRLSFTGELIYEINNLQTVHGTRQILALEDGDYILAGPNIKRIDSMGQLIWAKSYPNSHYSFRQMIRLPQSGDLILLGINLDPGPHFRHVMISRLSVDGEYYESDYYGGPYVFPTAVKAFEDDRLIITGMRLVLPYELDPDPGKLYLLYTHPPDRTTSIGNKEEIEFTIFPNPVLDQLHLRFTLLKTAEVEITLCDLVGRQLLPVQETSIFTPGEHRVNMEAADLVPGVYGLMMTVDGRTYYQPFVRQ